MVDGLCLVENRFGSWTDKVFLVFKPGPDNLVDFTARLHWAELCVYILFVQLMFLDSVSLEKPCVTTDLHLLLSAILSTHQPLHNPVGPSSLSDPPTKTHHLPFSSSWSLLSFPLTCWPSQLKPITPATSLVFPFF